MINPTFKDIGRRVLYRSRHFHKADLDGVLVRAAGELGRITSFNEHFVFVRYGIGDTSAATKREDLFWEYGDDRT